MIRILIAGEGPNEIGDKSDVEVHEGERSAGGGVIDAFLTKVRVSGWEVRCRMHWKDIPKLRVNVPGHEDAKAVRVLEMRAAELGCNALIFLRDRDGELARQRSIERAIAELSPRRHFVVAGGIPVEQLECWLLAICGVKATEIETDCVQQLSDVHGVASKNTNSMVQLVRNADILEIPTDAVSLWRWLRRVASSLRVNIPDGWPSVKAE